MLNSSPPILLSCASSPQWSRIRLDTALKQFVAHDMAIDIVDRFEPVQIKQDQPAGMFFALIFLVLEAFQKKPDD